MLEDADLVSPSQAGRNMGFDDFKWKDPAFPGATPKLAINAFLSVYRPKFTVLWKDYQVGYEKIKNNPALHRRVR